MEQINNLIIGAGPAGLAVAARLKNYGIEYELWEASDQVAYRWTRHYKRLHLHTVKDRSELPFVKFPEDYPTFVSRQQLLSYCRKYAETFDVKPKFGKSLATVHSNKDQWLVKDNHNQSYAVKNLVIATGLNSIPIRPQWPGMESFPGQIIHSSDYQESSSFHGNKCLVVGMGNTGAEIALDLAENNIDTSISVRSDLNIVPREAFGSPSQETAFKLSFLPVWLQDQLANLVKKITIGDLRPYGIRISKMSPLRQLRTTGKTPLIDLGTVSMIKKGQIKVIPDITSFHGNQVKLTDGSSKSFDVLICATGYRSGIEALVPEIKSYLDRYGNPKFSIGAGHWSGLYFLGFDNFRPGGILGIINKDSEQITRHIKHYRTPLNQVI